MKKQGELPETFNGPVLGHAQDRNLIGRQAGRFTELHSTPSNLLSTSPPSAASDISSASPPPPRLGIKHNNLCVVVVTPLLLDVAKRGNDKPALPACLPRNTGETGVLFMPAYGVAGRTPNLDEIPASRFHGDGSSPPSPDRCEPRPS